MVLSQQLEGNSFPVGNVEKQTFLSSLISENSGYIITRYASLLNMPVVYASLLDMPVVNASYLLIQ